jgi:hypothetical protein
VRQPRLHRRPRRLTEGASRSLPPLPLTIK